MSNKKVVVLTGASSGIGLATALKLATLGYTVYGGSRNAPESQTLKDAGIHTYALDLTNDASITRFFEWVKGNEDHVDALVNCAGFGLFGALEDVSLDDARKEMEVNLFGPARLIQLFLPMMRARGQGHIVNVASVAGRVSTMFGNWYCASKFAMEGLSDTLRAELIPFNIKVSVIEPGLIKTPIGEATADRLMKISGHGAYAGDVAKVVEVVKEEYSSDKISKPEEIAEAIVDAVQSENPKTRYLVGYGAKEVVGFRKTASDEEYDKFLRGRLDHTTKL